MKAGGSVHAFDSAVVPFHAHRLAFRYAAQTDNPVIGGMERQLEVHELLNQGFAVHAFQLSPALRILQFQSAQNLAVIADLVPTQGVHGSIPGNVMNCRVLRIEISKSAALGAALLEISI